MIKPLGELTWRDHKSALWWLGLLYRRPHRFREALEQLSRWRALWVGLLVLGHALPYVLVIAGLFRWFLFGLLDLPLREPIATDASALLVNAAAVLSGSAVAIAIGIAIGIVFAITPWIGQWITVGIAVGTVGGIVRGIGTGDEIVSAIFGGIVASVAVGRSVGIAVVIFAAILFGILSGTAEGMRVGIAAEGMWVGIASGIAAGIAALRAYYQPLHLVFVWPVLQARWYRIHPVAWDDRCLLPFPGLNRLLVAYAELSPEGSAEIWRLAFSYPSQRMQALRAWTILVARLARIIHEGGG